MEAGGENGRVGGLSVLTQPWTELWDVGRVQSVLVLCSALQDSPSSWRGF